MASGRQMIRRFTEKEIPFALEQTGREGWDSTAELFRVFLEHDTSGCFVAWEEGRPAGMVTTTRFKCTGWIGNLIVHPRFRRTGLGSDLMDHAVEHLQGSGCSTIRLEADPMGINIYRRLGFRDELESPRFLRQPTGASGTGGPGGIRNLEEIIDLDRQIFGDDRFLLLQALSGIALALYMESTKGKPAGYLMVLPGAGGVRFGPCVAKDRQAAADMYSKATKEYGGRRIVVALPGVNLDGIELLDELGFRPGPSSYRMIKGPVAASGQPGRVFAIASGACG